MRTIRGATGATYADSLALYNNALQTQGFYDSKAPYYETPWHGTFTNTAGYNVEKGRTSQETVNTIKNHLLSGSQRNTSREELNKLMQDPQMRNAPWVQGLDKVFQIQDNTNPNVQLISDLVTGAIDPYAPLVAYDKRILPSGTVNYKRKNNYLDLAKELGNADYESNLRYAAELFKKAENSPWNKLTSKSIESFDDMADSIKLNVVSGDGGISTGITSVVEKKDVIPLLNELKDASGLSEKEIIDKIYETHKKNMETVTNTPGNDTVIPYYDPIMVKPWKDLTPSEQQERIDKAVKYYKTGGLPPSIVEEVRKRMRHPSKQVQRTKQPIQQQPPADMQPMRSIPASQIEQVISQGLMPSRGINVGPTRSPRPIMRQDPTVSRGQYQVGELYWDDNRKKWQRDMWDKDERKQSRKEAKPRQERWRTIKAPKF